MDTVSTPQIEIKFDPDVILERCHQVKACLTTFHEQFDLTPYLFTDKINIQPYVQSHSHPTLTLNTRMAGSPDEILLTYLHEQIHWFCCTKEEAVRLAKKEFRKFYPEETIPGFAEGGGQDLESTYLHLIVCHLERMAGHRFLGMQRTDSILQKNGHYQWIYKEVIENDSLVSTVVEANGLVI